MESKERNPIEKAKTKSEIIKDNICNAGAYHPISIFHLTDSFLK